jgi:hypothetical protein
MRTINAIAVLLAFSTMAVLPSCKKDAPVLDELGPQINIIEPAQQSTFSVGEQIPLKIEISENLGLHGYFVWLIESATGTPHLIDKQHLHSTFVELSLDYPLPDLPPGKYEIIVEASDHDSNISEATIEVAIE